MPRQGSGTLFGRRTTLPVLALLAAAAIPAAPAQAETPVVEAIAAERTGATWRVSVTLRHPDTGWAHYADGWTVETEDGTVLAHRTLFHPHVDEQPFTRAQAGIEIPPGTTRIRIRAHCAQDGPAAEAIPFDLPGE